MTHDTEEQPLQVWEPKIGVKYITGDKEFIDPPFTQDDIEYIEQPKRKIDIPKDRQLFNIGGALIAMPKDMVSINNKINNIGVLKNRNQNILQKLTQLLLKFVRGKNAK